jgi:hypothetical protein
VPHPGIRSRNKRLAACQSPIRTVAARLRPDRASTPPHSVLQRVSRADTRYFGDVRVKDSKGLASQKKAKRQKAACSCVIRFGADTFPQKKHPPMISPDLWIATVVMRRQPGSTTCGWAIHPSWLIAPSSSDKSCCSSPRAARGEAYSSLTKLKICDDVLDVRLDLGGGGSHINDTSRRGLAPSPTCLICGKVVSTKVGCGRFYGKSSRVPPAFFAKRRVR